MEHLNQNSVSVWRLKNITVTAQLLHISRSWHHVNSQLWAPRNSTTQLTLVHTYAWFNSAIYRSVIKPFAFLFKTGQKNFEGAFLLLRIKLNLFPLQLMNCSNVFPTSETITKAITSSEFNPISHWIFSLNLPHSLMIPSTDHLASPSKALWSRGKYRK